MSFFKFQNTLCVYGGISDDDKKLGDLHLLEGDKWTCFEPSTQGNNLKPLELERSSHSTTILEEGKKILVYGGYYCYGNILNSMLVMEVKDLFFLSWYIVDCTKLHWEIGPNQINDVFKLLQ